MGETKSVRGFIICGCGMQRRPDDRFWGTIWHLPERPTSWS